MLRPDEESQKQKAVNRQESRQIPNSPMNSVAQLRSACTPSTPSRPRCKPKVPPKFMRIPLMPSSRPCSSDVSAVIVGSTASSAVYFGTCEFGKSFLSKIEGYLYVLILPSADTVGNIVSSAIMVPKELITQRTQDGAKGRSWEVLIKILEKDGVLGLYDGYSATLLRNLPAGVLSYSSFEYLKAAVLRSTKKGHLEPVQSVLCVALPGAISASLTTPLDVVKTRLMAQVHGEAVNKVAAVMYCGVSATVN